MSTSLRYFLAIFRPNWDVEGVSFTKKWQVNGKATLLNLFLPRAVLGQGIVHKDSPIVLGLIVTLQMTYSQLRKNQEPNCIEMNFSVQFVLNAEIIGNFGKKKKPLCRYISGWRLLVIMVNKTQE